MSTKSSNLGLTLVNSNEGATRFKDWVDLLTGTAETSNMQIIDAAVGQAEQSLSQHVANMTIHVSVGDKEAWNSKIALVQGYYSGGNFYEEADHLTLVTPNDKSLFVDNTGENKVLYGWDAVSQTYYPLGSGEESLDFGTWG